ncbi:TM2 domain-containing protein [Pustulibacterium marinum]|uniref:TM2 domain-containing protein n=1 Tax=Pustulibacterium marinum TaxID=1224947 RepID=A0A1I7FQP2_9FLAO|nr:TM2 domain-containing protein [Pustulibacterium marinum]SFU38455.1 TM2 domain-containing protein [Pustulibacterium marinum]
MNFKIILSLMVLLLATKFTYASFPVERVVKTTHAQETTVSSSEEDEEYVSPAAMAGKKSQGIAVILWFFLGGLAGHRWYLGSPWYWNVLFIITFGGFGIWWVIDLIDILTGNYPAKGGFKSDFF